MGRPRHPVGQLAKVRFRHHRKGVTGDTYVWDRSGRQRRLRLTGSSEAEALKLLKRKASVLGGAHVEASAHSTLAHLLDDWFTNIVQRRGLRPQTEDTYRRRIERLKKVFGAILVEQLTPTRVQGIAFDVSHLTESVIERRLLRSVLKQALRYATMVGIFTANPYAAVEPMPKRSETPNPTALNPVQVKVFRDAFAKYAAGASIYSSRRKAQLVVDIILGSGGLRINEVLGLRNRDVDFDAGVVHVNGTLTHPREVALLRQDELKGRQQAREVAITPGQVGYQALQVAWNESVDHSPDAPLIANVGPGSNPWIGARLIRHQIEAVRQLPEVVASLAETGLQPSDLTPHTLRRTVATIAASVIGKAQAAALLGHADQRTLETYYLHRDVPVVTAPSFVAFMTPAERSRVPVSEPLVGRVRTARLCPSKTGTA